MSDFYFKRSETHLLRNTQSTHTASIYSSSNQSITRLYELYKQKILLPKQNEVIKLDILKEIERLPSSFALDVAIKCIHRLLNSSHIINVDTNISLHQLLLLSYLAINDHKQRIGSYQDAQQLWLEGLYEIQRGNNLKLINNKIMDMGGTDDPICADGSFAKLIEKLQGIHPAIEMTFISKATASLKLPIIVKEELQHFLRLLIQGNHGQFSYFYAVAQKIYIENEQLECVWKHIEKKIMLRFYQEFHSLFPSSQYKHFFEFIATGIWVEPYPIQELQQDIQSSIHYKHFCKHLISNKTMMGLG